MQQLKDLPLVLTIPEVAKLLRVGRNSAYEAARRGELPTIRIGHRLLVPKAALEEMLQRGLGVTKQPPPSIRVKEVKLHHG